MKLLILTGDIVDSTGMSASELDNVMILLGSIARDVSGWGHSPEPGTALAPRHVFARRGGDGWQIAMNRPAYSLRAALFIQASLRACDQPVLSRIAVATGEGQLPEDTKKDLNSAYGEAFTASGRLLSDLPGPSLMAHASGGPIDAAFRLADHIATGWTQAQARAMAALLPPGAGPRRIAAERLGISRQAVDQALHAAGFPAVEAALEQIESSA